MTTDKPKTPDLFKTLIGTAGVVVLLLLLGIGVNYLLVRFFADMLSQ